MIYIGFSKPKKFKLFSALISAWIDKPYSHVYIRFKSSNPLVPSTVYHAANGMVHFVTEEKFLINNQVILEFSVSGDKTPFLIHCMKLAGESYGYCELLKILLSDFTGLKIFNKNGYGYICSELVGRLLIDQLNINFNKPTHLLRPDDIELAITNNILLYGKDSVFEEQKEKNSCSGDCTSCKCGN